MRAGGGERQIYSGLDSSKRPVLLLVIHLQCSATKQLALQREADPTRCQHPQRRAVWLSISSDLHQDATRDLRDLGEPAGVPVLCVSPGALECV